MPRHNSLRWRLLIGFVGVASLAFPTINPTFAQAPPKSVPPLDLGGDLFDKLSQKRQQRVEDQVAPAPREAATATQAVAPPAAEGPCLLPDNTVPQRRWWRFSRFRSR
jgi:hypothetical protein